MVVASMASSHGRVALGIIMAQGILRNPFRRTYQHATIPLHVRAPP